MSGGEVASSTAERSRMPAYDEVHAAGERALEDLDAAAMAYAGSFTAATAAERTLLRDELTRVCLPFASRSVPLPLRPAPAPPLPRPRRPPRGSRAGRPARAGQGHRPVRSRAR